MAPKIVKAGAKSWKTTVLGLVTGLIVVLGAVQAWVDGDPATVPDGNAAIQALVGIAIIVWGWVSRDADTSSKASGV